MPKPRSFNEFMHDRYMDCGVHTDQYLTLPCCHTVSREQLRMAGGLCPVCEQDKDTKEIGEFPPPEGYSLKN